MADFLWRLLARFITADPRRVARLVERAQRTPYSHLKGRNSDDEYMRRWWFFNPYGKDAEGNPTDARWSWLPSVRVHQIMRADNDDHMHDHPWNARTIVLAGWYVEERPLPDGEDMPEDTEDFRRYAYDDERTLHRRAVGYTGRLMFGEYHRIREVSPGGVWTLFFTWKYQGTWGFLVEGDKIPHKVYLQ